MSISLLADINYENVDQLHLNQRSYFGTVCHSSPLFFIIGNHEDEHQQKYSPEPISALYDALRDQITLLRALQADEDLVIRDEASFIPKKLPIAS